MKTTSRADLEAWLDGLAERYTLVAPTRMEGESLYGPVSSSAQVLLDFERTPLSPKTYLLPDTQTILEMEKRGKQLVLTEPTLGQEQVLFAVRPCDARALKALDALLLDRPPPDTYYAERRQKTTLVGLACARLWDDCFCTSLGSGPDDASAVDLMLHEEDGQYRVQEVTDRGAKLLEGLEVNEADSAGSAPETGTDPAPVLPPEAWGALFNEAYWTSLAERCLSCHACTYVCPTCRCFDVRDDTLVADAGYARMERLRAWDSCMAAAYRRIAGGHNPRPVKAQRLRNRYYCKFCYSPLDFGAVACVGCGRCIEVCPVGIDITEMLEDVAKLQVADQ